VAVSINTCMMITTISFEAFQNHSISLDY